MRQADLFSAELSAAQAAYRAPARPLHDVAYPDEPAPDEFDDVLLDTFDDSELYGEPERRSERQQAAWEAGVPLQGPL